MHIPVERFIGVLDDYTVLYLRTCDKCRVLITYKDQGHHCNGIPDTTEFKRIEAEHYVQLMQRVKKIFVQPSFDAPRD